MGGVRRFNWHSVCLGVRGLAGDGLIEICCSDPERDLSWCPSHLRTAIPSARAVSSPAFKGITASSICALAQPSRQNTLCEAAYAFRRHSSIDSRCRICLVQLLCRGVVLGLSVAGVLVPAETGVLCLTLGIETFHLRWSTLPLQVRQPAIVRQQLSFLRPRQHMRRRRQEKRAQSQPRRIGTWRKTRTYYDT